jgi:hypothetical protein
MWLLIPTPALSTCGTTAVLLVARSHGKQPLVFAAQSCHTNACRFPGGQIATGVGVPGQNIRLARIGTSGRADYVAIQESDGALRVWLNQCGQVIGNSGRAGGDGMCGTAPLPPQTTSESGPVPEPSSVIVVGGTTRTTTSNGQAIVTVDDGTTVIGTRTFLPRKTSIVGGSTVIVTSNGQTITTVQGGTTVEGSFTYAPVTSTMTTVPQQFSAAPFTDYPIAGNQWLTTTGSDAATTIVPLILPCPNCIPQVIWWLPTIPNVSFRLPGFDWLPKFHLPCIKIFGSRVAGTCPTDSGPPPVNDEGPITPQINPSNPSNGPGPGPGPPPGSNNGGGSQNPPGPGPGPGPGPPPGSNNGGGSQNPPGPGPGPGPDNNPNSQESQRSCNTETATDITYYVSYETNSEGSTTKTTTYSTGSSVARGCNVRASTVTSSTATCTGSCTTCGWSYSDVIAAADQVILDSGAAPVGRRK